MKNYEQWKTMKNYEKIKSDEKQWTKWKVTPFEFLLNFVQKFIKIGLETLTLIGLRVF